MNRKSVCVDKEFWGKWQHDGRRYVYVTEKVIATIYPPQYGTVGSDRFYCVTYSDQTQYKDSGMVKGVILAEAGGCIDAPEIFMASEKAPVARAKKYVEENIGKVVFKYRRAKRVRRQKGAGISYSIYD